MYNIQTIGYYTASHKPVTISNLVYVNDTQHYYKNNGYSVKEKYLHLFIYFLKEPFYLYSWPRALLYLSENVEKVLVYSQCALALCKNKGYFVLL